MRVKTAVKAGDEGIVNGALTHNHNEVQVRAGGREVRSGVKAGYQCDG